MNQTNLAVKLNQITDEVSRLSSDLAATEGTNPQRYPENFTDLLVSASLRAERLTCRLRQLVYAGANVKKAEYLRRAAAAQGIEIYRSGATATVRLPGLLPKRKGGHSSEFLVDTLFFAMSEYAMAYELPKPPHAVVCFIHAYAKEHSVRDYDNIECKQVLDVISLFALQDDSGACCDVYHTTRVGTEDETLIHIMPSEHFSTWVAEQSAARSV